MNLHLDKTHFDNLHLELIYQYAETIRIHFEALDIPKEKVKELTSSLLFDICMMGVEKSEMVTEDRDLVFPVLMFRLSEFTDTLIHSGGEYGMQHFTFQVIDDIFPE